MLKTHNHITNIIFIAEETQLYVTISYCGFVCYSSEYGSRSIFRNVFLPENKMWEKPRDSTLRTVQNLIACWRLRTSITNIDSIQHWKNISWKYLSLFVCLFELCSASINALQIVFSNISYDITNKLETFLAWQSPVDQGLLIHEVSRSHTTTHTVGGTPLDEWLARRRDFYLKTLNTHNTHNS